jgi:hypothetical protein
MMDQESFVVVVVVEVNNEECLRAILHVFRAKNTTLNHTN